jgi:hypothetical protein
VGRKRERRLGVRADAELAPELPVSTRPTTGSWACTGGGDGAYPSSFGCSHDDEPVVLLTDFGLVT